MAEEYRFVEDHDPQREYGHWVEELFAPSTKLTIDNLFKDISDDKTHNTKTAEPLEEIYSKLLKYCGTTERYYDEDSIIAGEAIALKKSGNSINTERAKGLQERGHQPLKMKTMRSVKTQFPSGRRLKLLESSAEAQSTLWTAGELRFLREYYKTVKAKNEFLVNELDVLKKEHLQLVKLFEKEKSELKEKTDLLTETLKSNVQMTIQINHLNRDVAEFRKNTIQQTTELKQLREENLSTHKQLSQIGKKLHDEKIRHARSENSLATREATVQRDWELKEIKLTQHFENQIRKLEDTVESLSTNLDKEQRSHARTTKALNHLRKHFACQSLGLNEYQTKLDQIDLLH